MNKPYDEQLNEARTKVAKLRENNSKLRVFQILVPGHDDEVFLARKASWAEYKRLIGSVQNEADANEVVVQAFLIYPSVDYETIQLDWDPGLLVTLAQQIQEGLGFTKGASVKNW